MQNKKRKDKKRSKERKRDAEGWGKTPRAVTGPKVKMMERWEEGRKGQVGIVSEGEFLGGLVRGPQTAAGNESTGEKSRFLWDKMAFPLTDTFSVAMS